MNPEASAHLKQLLEGQRVLSVAVVIEGEAHIGLLPFAVLPDHTGVIVHVSSLAKHTRGLATSGRAAVLIHQSEEAVGDPLQVPRLTFETEVRELRRDTPDYEQGKREYLARFVDAAVTFSLGDFRLFELKFLRGRFVEGFARALDITAEDLRAMAPPELPRKHEEDPRAHRMWMIPRD